MRVSKSTRERIAHIKTEAHEIKGKLMIIKARLDEHCGTKRTAERLARIIDQLDQWQKTA